ncbi:MAG TPA: hypothetical protein VM509_13105, partial [Planctomycetota bacterium]|nr:hypothetical protein [Planctomycetota bacterium]
IIDVRPHASRRQRFEGVAPELVRTALADNFAELWYSADARSNDWLARGIDNLAAQCATALACAESKQRGESLQRSIPFDRLEHSANERRHEDPELIRLFAEAIEIKLPNPSTDPLETLGSASSARVPKSAASRFRGIKKQEIDDRIMRIAADELEREHARAARRLRERGPLRRCPNRGDRQAPSPEVAAAADRTLLDAHRRMTFHHELDDQLAREMLRDWRIRQLQLEWRTSSNLAARDRERPVFRRDQQRSATLARWVAATADRRGREDPWFLVAQRDRLRLRRANQREREEEHARSSLVSDFSALGDIL